MHKCVGCGGDIQDTERRSVIEAANHLHSKQVEAIGRMENRPPSLGEICAGCFNGWYTAANQAIAMDKK